MHKHRNPFAHKHMPNLHIVTDSALVASSPERDAWAARMSRSRTGTLPTFTPGELVTDGDMRSDFHGEVFVVTAVNGDLVTLGNPEWGGETVLTGVHRTFLDHTGRRWTDKTCPCPPYHRRASDGVCMTFDCPARRD